MTNKNSYHFRDNEKILDSLEKGTRSKFIRDSLKLKINIDDSAYQEKQATYKELIAHYNEIIKMYEEEINSREEEINQIKKLKQATKIKIYNKEKKLNELLNQINTKKRLIDDYDTIKHKNETANTLVKNIILTKDSAEATPVNIEYLLEHGGFKNRKEFAIFIQEYIIENVKVNDVIGHRIIKPEDIEYIKDTAKRRILK